MACTTCSSLTFGSASSMTSDPSLDSSAHRSHAGRPEEPTTLPDVPRPLDWLRRGAPLKAPYRTDIGRFKTAMSLATSPSKVAWSTWLRKSAITRSRTVWAKSSFAGFQPLST